MVNATFLFQDMRTLTSAPYKNLLNLGMHINEGNAKLFRYIEFELGWSTNDALAKKQLSKLKIYKGTVHPHESQKPKIIDFSRLNPKNNISIR